MVSDSAKGLGGPAASSCKRRHMLGGMVMAGGKSQAEASQPHPNPADCRLPERALGARRSARCAAPGSPGRGCHVLRQADHPPPASCSCPARSQTRSSGSEAASWRQCCCCGTASGRQQLWHVAGGRQQRPQPSSGQRWPRNCLQQCPQTLLPGHEAPGESRPCAGSWLTKL